MSVTSLISTPEEAAEAVAELIQNNASSLGIEYVGKYDERLIPSYPAVIISAGQKTKRIHATHTFAVDLNCILWVYHANMTKTHQERSLEDLLLATALEALIEDDKTLGQRVIFCYVESSVPGTIAPRSGRGDIVVGTKMNWVAESQQRWS